MTVHSKLPVLNRNTVLNSITPNLLLLVRCLAMHSTLTEAAEAAVQTAGQRTDAEQHY
jgi:hypothetical protein